jgi:hypothetical protein
MKFQFVSLARGLRRRALTQSILFAAAIVCAFAFGGAAWSQENKPLSRNVVSATDPNHKAHVFFSVEAEKAFRAQVLGSKAPPIGAGPTPGNLVYNGGPVMRNPTNYLIFWQPPNNTNTFPAGYQAGIEKYFTNLGVTPFYNIVTQYNDTSAVPVPNSASLGAPSFTDTTTLPPSGNNGSMPTSTCTAGVNCPLLDSDIQNEVTVALAANPSWKAPGINVEYFVFTPPNVGECFNPTTCFALPAEPQGVFCAYHTFFAGTTIYAYQPFAASGSCFPFPGGPTTFPNGVNIDIELSPVSHEMFESNTDPLLNAWFGTGGLSDEIGDKCAYNYGFFSPDGTNIVLMGHPFQLQQEFSNDITACTKRFGAAPGTSIPSSLNFGTVAAGTTRTKNVLIQNNAGGDLNVLNIRLGPGTDPSYSLLNVPPTTATLPESDSRSVAVQFAPTVFPPAGPLTGSLVVDTDDPAQTTFTTSLSGLVSMSCAAPSGTINVTGSGNFGTASCSGTTPTQTLVVNNVGTCNLDVTPAPVITCPVTANNPGGLPQFTLVNPGEFPAMISPDSGLNLGINFTPTQAGLQTCTLTITSSDPANPSVMIPLTGNTALGTGSLTFPTGLTFPPTVVQTKAVCSATLGVPIANSGACPVQVNSVGLTQTSVSPPGLDYSLTGLPTLPLSVPAGGQLGSGDLDLVFAPFAIAQFSTGTVDVTFVNDPITGATSTSHVPFCGEGVRRGLRVLVTQGGSPVTTVKRIELQEAFGPEQQFGIFTLRTIKNAALTTVTGTPPCPTFSYHGDFGDLGNPHQLKDGTYRVKVILKGVKKPKIVRINLDACSFTPDVVVAFP